jgi:trk system potassium uptake protein TrkH
MPLYDSLIHAFGTAGTGGFSMKNLSVGAYDNVYAEVIISVFMLLFGLNFSLYYQLIKGNMRSVFKNEEFRAYIGIVFVAILLITLNTWGSNFDSVWQALRHSSFQVSSIITTTGYATTDFNLWPLFSKFILILLMFIGASAGSTGGGIKVVRFVLLFKAARREIMKAIHPRSVYSVKLDGKSIDDETLSGIKIFFFLYIFIFAVSVLIVSYDCNDFTTSFSAVAATLGNIGPGLGLVGPMGNFSDLSVLSKLVLSLCMIIGRLEILPMLLLFTPKFWKRVNI